MTLENAKLAVCAMLVVLMVARVVVDGVTTFFEWKYWRHFREQNKDAMQDGGVAGSANERVSFDYDVDACESSRQPSATPSAPKQASMESGSAASDSNFSSSSELL